MITYRSNLLSGRTKSCGCRNYKNRREYKNLINKTPDKLVAIKPAKLRSEGTIVWECQCLRGRKKLVSARRLLRDDVKGCGCLKSKKHHIENRKSGLLTAKYPLDNNCSQKTKWAYHYGCGSMREISYSSLFFEHTQSCGCLKRQETRICVEGIVIECLTSKLLENNTNGVKGVYRSKKKQIAYITLKKKKYHLRSCDSIESAAQTGKDAENRLFRPLVDKY